MGTTTWCSWLGDSTFAMAVSILGTHWMSQSGFLGPVGRSRRVFAPRQLNAWVLARQGNRWVAPAPDLGTLLEVRGLSESAREDLQRFADLLAPRRSSVFVGRCVADDQGSFAVAVYTTALEGPEPRVGDSYFSGVQLSGCVGPGVVVVEPHILRRICINGATVHVSADCGAYARWSGDDVEGSLDAVVEMGLSGRLARDVESELRRAAATPLPRLSELRARGLLKIDDDLAAAIMRAMRRESRTLYGLYNAMTRVARDTSDLRAAIALERSAGRLVAELVRRPEREHDDQRRLHPV